MHAEMDSPLSGYFKVKARLLRCSTSDALPLPANRRAAAPGLASTRFRSLGRVARAKGIFGYAFPFTRDGPRLREQAPFANKAVRTQQPSGVVLPKECHANPAT